MRAGRSAPRCRGALVALALASTAHAGEWSASGPASGDRETAATTALSAAPLARALARRTWQALNRREREALLARLRRQAEASVGTPWPWAALGTLLHVAGDAPGAGDAFALALARLPGQAPPETGAALRQALARARLDAGRPDLACAALLDGAQAPPWSGESLDLARRLASPGRGQPPANCAQEYIARLLPVTRNAPERDRLLELAAELATAANDHEAAFAMWAQRVLGGAPPPTRVTAASWRALLVSAVRADRLASLEHALSEHVQRHPRDALAWGTAIRARVLRGDPEGALRLALAGHARAPHDAALAGQALALARAAGDSAAVLRLTRARGGADDLGWGPEVAAPAPRDRTERRWRASLARHRGDPAALARLADQATAAGRDDLALSAWQAVLRIRPRDAAARSALGELHFQGGRRELALATWQRMLPRGRPDAAAHVRLALLLSDHGLLDAATEQLRRADALAPSDAGLLRAHAIVAERRRQPREALAYWRALLDGTRARGAAAERREARARVRALLATGAADPQDAGLDELRGRCERDGCDDEDTLLLVELERASRRPQRAASLLEAAVARRPHAAPLVRELLEHYRQSGQLGAATALLERLASGAGPEHAWATLRLVELALEGGRRTLAAQRVRAALEARRLPLSELPRALLPAAIDLGSLLGDDAASRAGLVAAASSSLREPDGLGPRARADVARFLIGAHESAGLAETLALQAGASATDLGALARVLAELDGTLARLERVVGSAAAVAAIDEGQPDLDELHRELLGLLVPPLYRRATRDGSGVATAELARLAELGLRPLLDQLRSGPRPATIMLLGMLGQGRAVPALEAYLRALPSSPMSGPDPLATQAPRLADQAARALVALGRLADARALPTVLEVAPRLGPTGGLAALWAIGRLTPGPTGDPPAGAARDTAAALARIDEALVQSRHPDLAAMAALTLGRAALVPASAASTRLIRLVGDPTRPLAVRRAAALGLARRARAAPGSSEDPTAPAALSQPARAALIAALHGEQVGLRQAAARALSSLGELPALFEALLGAAPVDMDWLASTLASAGRALPDEAAAFDDLPTPEALLRALLSDEDAELARGEPAPALRALLAEHAPTLRAQLALALRPGPALEPGGPLRALLSLARTLERTSVGAEVALVREVIAEPLRARLTALAAAQRLDAIELLLVAGPGHATLEDLLPALTAPDPRSGARSLAGLAARAREILAHPALGGASPRRLGELLDARWVDLSVPARVLCARLAAHLGPHGEALLSAAARDPDPVVRRAASSH